MFNSKVLFFSCALFMIYWSGTNAGMVAAVKKQYPHYHGAIVLPNNTAHPTSLCQEKLNSSSASWVNDQEPHICNSRIRCATSLFSQTLTLDQYPPSGSVGPTWVCLNGTKNEVKDIDKYQ